MILRDYAMRPWLLMLHVVLLLGILPSLVLLGVLVALYLWHRNVLRDRFEQIAQGSFQLAEARPLLGDGMPALFDHCYKLPRHLGGDGRPLVADGHRVNHLMIVLVGPRKLSRVHLPQHHGETVKIDFLRDRLVTQHLRGLIRWGPCCVAHSLDEGCILQAGQPKVAQFHLSLVVHKKAVLRLEVTVNNVSFVQIRHSIANADCNLQTLPIGQPLILLVEVVE
mmetsp:Transcript_12269/g.28318  ORF Transcript_12269/g.28318 Transcript_12269/m.28318 type:complete len:223 (-) Transcript_12269:1729-2397(-)